MIDGEFESFVEKFNENKIENEKFVETDDYEFEYSHNDTARKPRVPPIPFSIVAAILSSVIRCT